MTHLYSLKWLDDDDDDGGGDDEAAAHDDGDDGLNKITNEQLWT